MRVHMLELSAKDQAYGLRLKDGGILYDQNGWKKSKRLDLKWEGKGRPRGVKLGYRLAWFGSSSGNQSPSQTWGQRMLCLRNMPFEI